MGKSLIPSGASPVGLFLHFGTRLVSFLELCGHRFQFRFQRADQLFLGSGLSLRQRYFPAGTFNGRA